MKEENEKLIYGLPSSIESQIEDRKFIKNKWCIIKIYLPLSNEHKFGLKELGISLSQDRSFTGIVTRARVSV